MATAESPHSIRLAKDPAASPEILLHSGDRLDQPQFHSLYQNTPPSFKAELIDGVVTVASPVSYDHASFHAAIMAWASAYWLETPGVTLQDNATLILGLRNEPQPDALLRLEPNRGGRSQVAGQYLTGPPEFVIEIAYSSWSVDLNAKREIYQAAGIPEYLVIDIHDSQVHWFMLNAGQYITLEPEADGLYHSHVFPGLWLNAKALFESKPQELLASLRLGLASQEHAKFIEQLSPTR